MDRVTGAAVLALAPWGAGGDATHAARGSPTGAVHTARPAAPLRGLRRASVLPLGRWTSVLPRVRRASLLPLVRRASVLAFVVLVVAMTGCTRAGPEPTPPPAPPALPPPSMDRPPPATAMDRPPPALPPAPPTRPDVATPPAGTPGARPPATAPPPLPDDGLLPPVRALWVVRTALVHPDSARAAVIRAHEAGFNTLLVQVRGRADAWYTSVREPRPEPLRGGDPSYDPLRVVLDEAQRRGLHVHAWVNVHLVSGALRPHSDPLHLTRSRPELLAVPRELAPRLFDLDPRDPRYLDALLAHARTNGERVEGVYSSPVLPEVRAHLVGVVGDLLDRYALDGIHLDYLRFPSREYDYGRRALEAFRDHVRARQPGAEAEAAETRWRAGDPFAYTDLFDAEWDAFREAGVTATLEAVAAEVARRQGEGPGRWLTAAVFPDPTDARVHRFQPWTDWLARGLLDAAAPMAYTTSDSAYRAVLRDAAGPAGAGRVWAGVGAYTNSLEGAVDKARLAAEAGVSGVVLFSYDWAVGPQGRAAARGDYLLRFGLEAFMPRSGSPPSGR